MPAEEFELSARLGRVHARRWGSSAAPLLVIGLPGLSGTGERFAFLGDRIGGDRVQLVALDPRGRGQSETTAPGSYGWENHARDVLAVADALGFGRFAIVGQSMGGSVAMKTAELDGSRLTGVVLIDVAGRVDRGVGAVIASEIERLDRVYSSVDEYLEEVRIDGRIEPWNEYWDRAYRAEVIEMNGCVMHRANASAVAEDRAYTVTQDAYGRWTHLTMPTLLLRATRELEPGCGFIVPADDRDRFVRDVPSATVVEIDANHLSITTHDDAAAAIADFVGRI
jgi:pimeloyl-ACP methyl ester carboxylesterase